jgi:hypothetical protein
LIQKGLQHSKDYLKKGCLEMNAKKEGGNGEYFSERMHALKWY